MLSDFNTNKIYFSEILRTKPEFENTFKQIESILSKLRLPFDYLPETNDIWARDYMPIQVSDNKLIEYRYDPNYLQDISYRRRKTYPDLVCESLGIKTIKTDIILDGGNVVKSENCAILTDKVILENKHKYNKGKLIQKLTELFEIEKIVLIPWDRKEKYGHSDGVLKFIDNDTVLINEIYMKDKNLITQLKSSGLRHEVLRVKTNRIHKWNWAYINFLQTKDLILVPKFEIEEDYKALEQLSIYYPEYSKRNNIIQIELSEIVKGGGALNCISWTIKE